MRKAAIVAGGLAVLLFAAYLSERGWKAAAPPAPEAPALEACERDSDCVNVAYACCCAREDRAINKARRAQWDAIVAAKPRCEVCPARVCERVQEPRPPRCAAGRCELVRGP